MSKTIRITVRCPKCTSPSSISIVEDDVGTKKNAICPKCRCNYLVNIPISYASRFVSDPTHIGEKEVEMSLILEAFSDDMTDFQSFELTSDYYTIGRKNSSGPANRPDIEVVTADMRMSRKHAVIKKKKVGFTLKDIGSKNGVVINGNKLDEDEEVYLNDGDMFRLGNTRFHVTLSEKTDTNNDITRL